MRAMSAERPGPFTGYAWSSCGTADKSFGSGLGERFSGLGWLSILGAGILATRFGPIRLDRCKKQWGLHDCESNLGSTAKNEGEKLLANESEGRHAPLGLGFSNAVLTAKLAVFRDS